MPRIKLHCQHVDTCLPDYWGGHHLPHIMIPVHPDMTFSDIRRDLRSEIAQGAVMGNSDYARLLSADFVKPEEVSMADAVTRAAYAAVARDVKPAKKGARKPFRDVEADNACCDSVYAYFVFVEVN